MIIDYDKTVSRFFYILYRTDLITLIYHHGYADYRYLAVAYMPHRKGRGMTHPVARVGDSRKPR